MCLGTRPAVPEAAWSSTEFNAAMQTAEVYVAGGNPFWTNAGRLTSPTVALNQKSIGIMKKAFFETGPSKLGLEIVVAEDSKL